MPLRSDTREAAERLDREDPLKRFRDEFIFPTKADLKSKTLEKSTNDSEADFQPCIYLCGNSLGLQPRRTAQRVSEHLTGWARKGVYGHFVEVEGTNTVPWLEVDDLAAEKMASLVGAQKTEVAVMETLTANLHLLMSSFYRPTQEKFKIILEGKAFPSDNYAVYSQILNHGLDPTEAMILIEPIGEASTITTEQVLSTIDQHASSTALILLPGIQYYTGQLLDMEKITAHAHSLNLIIGWDLAHAVGNVELFLHDWNVDFAAWCTYKYVNAGPGAIAGLFVHEKHGKVHNADDALGNPLYRPRLSGWWGGDKSIRFEMGARFKPIPGAAGFQVGNPSALSITGLLASLEIFSETTMAAIRAKSIKITSFLEKLLLQPIQEGEALPYKIITPSDPRQRGAQLSVKLGHGMLDKVMAGLEEAGVVVDERKPDVVRVAPAPLYNSYKDVLDFVEIFQQVCTQARTSKPSVEN